MKDNFENWAEKENHKEAAKVRQQSEALLSIFFKEQEGWEVENSQALEQKRSEAVATEIRLLLTEEGPDFTRKVLNVCLQSLQNGVDLLSGDFDSLNSANQIRIIEQGLKDIDSIF